MLKNAKEALVLIMISYYQILWINLQLNYIFTFLSYQYDNIGNYYKILLIYLLFLDN